MVAVAAMLLGAARAAQQLDTVDFGSAASLASHNAHTQNVTTVVGGLGARGLAFTSPHGSISGPHVPGTGWVKVDVEIDPTLAKHYVTLKLWGAGCGHFGNETCITQLHHPDLLKASMSIADFQASQLAASQEGHASASNPNPCTLDFSNPGGSDLVRYNGPAPGVFQYSTYILPGSLINDTVRRTGKPTLAIGSGTYQVRTSSIHSLVSQPNPPHCLQGEPPASGAPTPPAAAGDSNYICASPPPAPARNRPTDRRVSSGRGPSTNCSSTAATTGAVAPTLT
eukprot:COSAG01_NODE_16172_length_1263_cov_1.323024_2_plen_283_part_00